MTDFRERDVVRCVNVGKRPLADTGPEGLIVGREYVVDFVSPEDPQGQGLVLHGIQSPHWSGGYHSSHFELVRRGTNQ